MPSPVVHSNVSAIMFRDIGAPIQPASASQAALFDNDMIEAVFACHETAFDYSILENLLSARLASAGVEMSTKLVTLADAQTGIVAGLSNGSEVTARYAFNVPIPKSMLFWIRQIYPAAAQARIDRTRPRHSTTGARRNRRDSHGWTFLFLHAPRKTSLFPDACALYASRKLDGRFLSARPISSCPSISRVPRDTYDQTANAICPIWPTRGSCSK